ncbi:MAG: RNA polymerase sigma factor [Chitinophagaceae bacterium]
MTETRFLSLVVPLQHRMFRLAYTFLRDEEEAKDVVQDALVKLWANRDALPAIKSMEAWCIRITKNTILDRLKYNRYRQTSDIDKHADELATTGMEDAAEVNDGIRAAKKIISQLPEKYRFLIHLRDVEGLAYDEIARIMELSLPEVKTGIYRARQAVKENLKSLNSYGLR